MPQASKLKISAASPKKEKNAKRKAGLNSLDASKESVDHSQSPANENKPEPSPILYAAWHRVAVLDRTYSTNARDGYKLYRAVLVVTIASIAMAVTYDALKPIDQEWALLIKKFLKYLVILAPIAVSVLAAMSVSLGISLPRGFLEKNMSSVANNLDTKSPSMQSDIAKISTASQLIRREIYLFRARQGDYKQNPQAKTREQILMERMNAIEEQLSKTGAIRVGLVPYDGPIPQYYFSEDPGSDPGFHDFTGDEYFLYRTGIMLQWFSVKTNRLSAEKKRLLWRIYIIGGLGTFLAAIGLEIWLAVTSSIVGALTSTQEQRNIDQMIAEYNQIAGELRQISAWWLTLTDHEKNRPEKVGELVLRTENALITENEEKAFWGRKKQFRFASDA